MKTLTFLLIAFLVSCIVTLKKREQEAKKKVKKLTKVIVLKNDTIEFKTKALIKIYSSPYWSNLEKDY
jgi:hypothetical protein